MIPTELLVIIAIVAVLLIVSVVGADVIDSFRRKDFQKAAADLHFSFHDKDQSTLPDGADRFHLMRLGQVRVAERIMRGEANGIRVTIFEMGNTSNLGLTIKTSVQTVVCFESERLALPWFFLRPAALTRQLPAPPGLADTKADELLHLAPSFAVATEAGKEPQVGKIFDKSLVDSLRESEGVCIEGWERLLVIYYPGRAVPLSGYPQLLEDAFAVFSQFTR